MRNTRFRSWTALAVAIALSGLAAFAGLGAAINVFSAGHGGVGIGASITLLVICTAVLGTCVRWAVHVEHRLRSPHASDPARGAAPDAAARAPGLRRTKWHHHRQGPVATTFGAVFFSLLVIGFAIGTIQAISDWRLSRFVQAHGVLAQGTVVSAHNIEHRGRYGTWHTADIDVTLQAPVGGQTATTVHDPAAAAFLPGETISVLVNPNQPRYAELPGSPYSQSGAWIGLLIFVVIFLFVASIYWWELGARIRQRYQKPEMAAAVQLSP